MKIKTRKLNKYIPVVNQPVLFTGQFYWRLFDSRYTFCVSGAVHYQDTQLYKKVSYRKQYKVKFSQKNL